MNTNSNSESQYVIGVDIGGSHVTAGVVDMETRRLLEYAKVRKDVNSKGSREHILGTWLAALREVLKAEFYIEKIAFAMPGPFDYENGIALITGLDKFEAIYGVDVREYIAGQMNLRPENIFFRNDAEAFLHGEMFCGAGADLEAAIGFTLGTGFGSAFSQRGITTDLNFGSYSFKDSIADDYFSTRWFTRRYMELTGRAVVNVKDMMKIIQQDGSGGEIFREFADNLTLFLHAHLPNYSSRDVILGGNIAQARNNFLPLLLRSLADRGIKVNFKPAVLNEDAALIGAAASFEKIVIE